MAVTMQEVSEALAELGKLRFGEMRVEDAMHDIVRSTHAIFDVDGAGLMLADTDHQLRNVAVSDERFGHLEDLQVEHGEGPCIAAFTDKELVGAEDLTTDTGGRCSARPRSARGPGRAGQPAALQPGRGRRGGGAVRGPAPVVTRG